MRAQTSPCLRFQPRSQRSDHKSLYNKMKEGSIYSFHSYKRGIHLWESRFQTYVKQIPSDEAVRLT